MKTSAVVAPAVAHTPGTWRLLYFNAPTRGEQIRVLFACASVPLVDVRLEFPRGLDPYKKAAMGDLSPLCGTDLCPAVTAPDGTHCVETSDIMQFVGRRVGLAPPADSAADATAMTVCLMAQSVLNDVFYPLLKPMVVRQIFASEFCGALWWVRRLIVGPERAYLPKPSAALSRALAAAEAAIATSGGPWVCGSELSYADVALFAVLDEVLAFDCFHEDALLAAHPLVASLMAALRDRTSDYVQQRVREHQLGYRSTIALFAAKFTPFPWSRA